MRRALRFSVWALRAVLFLGMVCCGVVFVAGSTDGGQALIERLTSGVTAGRVKLSGLGGEFPSVIRCDRLQLADQHGVWLTAEHVSLGWLPSALLSRRVQVDQLFADRVSIERWPVTTRDKASVMPIPHVDVLALSINELTFGAPLVGIPAKLSVQGNVHLRSSQDVAVHLTARRIGAEGDYDLRALSSPNRVDAVLKLQEPPGGPLENILGMPGLGGLSATASLHGPRAGAKLDLSLNAGDLRAGVQGRIDLIESSVDLTYALNAPAMAPRPGLSWKSLALQGRWQGAVLAPIASARLQVKQLQLADSTRIAALNANLSTESGKLALHAVLDGGEIFGQDLRGNALLNARIAQVDGKVSITADGVAGIASGSKLWADALGHTVKWRASAGMTNQSLHLEKLSLVGRAVALSVDRGRWNLSVKDLSVLSPELKGVLALSGSVANPAVHTVLSSTFSVHDSPSATVTADLRMQGRLMSSTGTLEVHGTFGDAPLHIQSALRLDPDHMLHAGIGVANWKSLSITGDITSGAEVSKARGMFRAHWGNLGDLNSLLGVNLSGVAAGSLSFAPLNAQWQVNAQDVAAGQLRGNIQLTGSGPLDAMNVSLTSQLPDVLGSPASGVSTGRLNLASSELYLTSAQASLRGQTANLLAPARISFRNGLSVTQLKLGVQQALFEVEGRLSPLVDLRAEFHQIKPSLIDAFVPGLLSDGTVDGSARLGGTLSALTGQVQVNALSMRLASDEIGGLPGTDVHAAAQLSGEQAQLDVQVSSGGNSHLSVSGRAPFQAGGPLDLRLIGKADAALISPLLEAQGQRIAGELDVDATISGSFLAPKIGGVVRIAKGELRDYAKGFGISDIEAQMIGSEGMLRLTSFAARVGSGSLSMSGTIGVLQPGFPVDLVLKAHDAQPIISPLVTANLNADLQVRGAARKGLDVSGSVQVTRARIGVPSNLPLDVAVLNVRRKGEAAPAPRDDPTVIGLDIALRAPRQILVQGRGLDAEVGGEIHISGTTDAPIVSGAFDLQQGRFSLASTELKFTSGNVTFNGTGLQNKIDPTVSFMAQTTVAGVAATLRISGFADSPRFDLTSTPELPQDEILARLLFGKSASQLAPLQMAQIGAAVATLGGSGAELNPLARIQKTLGLDRLAFGSGAGTGATSGEQNSGTSIEAGRYISSRVYVGAKQSTNGMSQLQVDANLSAHLKIQTRLGNGAATAQGITPDNDPGSSVGLTYEIEY